MKSDPGAKAPKTGKTFDDMEYSEDDVERILKMLAIELDAANVDLEEKVYDRDRHGLLNEEEFERMFRGIKLNTQLSKRDIETLINKYYNTANKKIQADQLVKDIHKHKLLSEESNRKSKHVSSASIDKVSKYIKRKRLERRSIEEVFLADQDNDGLLQPSQIKAAFHNAGVKLSTDQINDLLKSLEKHRGGKYDYVQLLVSLFGETSDIRKHKSKLKNRSPDRRHSTKKKLFNQEEEKHNRDGTMKHRYSHKEEGRDHDAESRHSPRDRHSRHLRDQDDYSRSRPRDDTKSRDRDDDYSRSRPRDDTRSRGRDESSPRRRDDTRSRGRDDTRSRGRDYSRSNSRDQERNYGRSRSRGRDSEKSFDGRRDSIRSRGSERSYESRSRSRPKRGLSQKSNHEDDYETRSRGGRSDRHDDSISPDDRKPIKGSHKSKEIDSITRIVGTRMKNIDERDIIKAFEKASKHDKSKLISDKQLMDALDELNIELKFGDKERLSLELDTQKIRRIDNTFNYEDFLKKAGVLDGRANFINRPLNKSQDRHSKSPNKRLDNEKEDKSLSPRKDKITGLTMSETNQAKDVIYDINKELDSKRKDLHEILDIRPNDRDIFFKQIHDGLEDHLGNFGFKVANNRSLMKILKAYL